jgi:hypothetical protein
MTAKTVYVKYIAAANCRLFFQYYAVTCTGSMTTTSSHQKYIIYAGILHAIDLTLKESRAVSYMVGDVHMYAYKLTDGRLHIKALSEALLRLLDITTTQPTQCFIHRS